MAQLVEQLKAIDRRILVVVVGILVLMCLCYCGLLLMGPQEAEPTDAISLSNATIAAKYTSRNRRIEEAIE